VYAWRKIRTHWKKTRSAAAKISVDGIRWIIDYKTIRHQGAALEAFLKREQERYATQMKNHAALLNEMDDRPVKLGLHFPFYRAGGNGKECYNIFDHIAANRSLVLNPRQMYFGSQPLK
jgi:hypothetical protein